MCNCQYTLPGPDSPFSSVFHMHMETKSLSYFLF